MSNEKYLNECAEALAAYLNCEIEEIEINENFEEIIVSNFIYENVHYSIAPAEDVVCFIKDVLLPEKIQEIEDELRLNNLYNYVEDLNVYAIEEEIFENLEAYFYSPNLRVPFEYKNISYLIFE